MVGWLRHQVDPHELFWPQFLYFFKVKATKEFILMNFQADLSQSHLEGEFHVELLNHFNASLTQTTATPKWLPMTEEAKMESTMRAMKNCSREAARARMADRNLMLTYLVNRLRPYDEPLDALYSRPVSWLSEALHLPKIVPSQNETRSRIVRHLIEDELLRRKVLPPMASLSHHDVDAVIGNETLVSCGTYKLHVPDSCTMPKGVNPYYFITSPLDDPMDARRMRFAASNADVKPFVNTSEYFADLNDRLKQLLTSPSSKKVLYMMGWMFSLDMRLVPSNDQSTLKHHLINLKHANVEIRILFWRWGNFFLERSFDPLSTDAANTASTLQSIGLLEGEHYLGHRIGKEEGMVATHVYSHHQKHITILDGDNLTAYCGGCDIAVGRFDDATKSVFYNDELEGRYDTSLCYGGTKNDDEAFTLQDFTSGSPRLPWQDVQVRVEGLAALEIAATFEHFFRRAVAEQFPNNNEDTLPTLKYAPADPPTTAPNAVVQIVHARDRGYGFEEFMVQLIGKATESIYIEQQHFQGYVSADSRSNHLKNRVPFAIVEKIKERNDPAFNVHVVLPLIPDCFLKLDNAVTKHILRLHHETKVAMMKEIPPHLQQCLKFYYLSSTTQGDNGNTINFPFLVHSKVMIVDKAVCVIGSANINDRSMLAYRDTEMVAVIHSPEVASKLEEDLCRQHAAFLKDFPIDLAQESIGYCNEDVNIQLFTEHDRPNCYSYDALFG
ncbi:Hypothetical protein, putative [Bodo saltans]|uniref:phospholipase D n=1 Tax=Bodo saltans TaxID=75058 RepID=A0A0S4J151_BODSA|nr:Hypothetical protein, putative [Bodo saltans]|eukprot:CUG07265.1 Hypothetical protein, putative [Bodo saltans]